MTLSTERLGELISRTGPGDMLHVNDEADMNAALRELLAARAEIAELRKDAERYRWILQHNVAAKDDPAAFTAYIDAALAARGGHE
jgi:hypothetical protein